MEYTMPMIIAAAALFFAAAGTIDLREGDNLHGRKRLYWLLVIWLVPFIGFLLYRLQAPQPASFADDDADDAFCVDDVVDAADAFLQIPDQD